ncbi:MAG: DUF116 domain-containing protein [Bacteroidales bacterium]|nr:DUF116 domain-containing protein [Bacteroidales bacterium]
MGVACMLNLIEGGYLLKKLKLPAQCVPLDSSACKNHWFTEEKSTMLNQGRLTHLLSGRKT